jgi:DNA-binding NarL/FixJ family response regulator
VPAELSAARLRFGRDELAVLSFPTEAPPLDARLSPAEQEVARALLAGQRNADIAERRGSSLRTVANQVASILRKTGVRSRADFVARYLGRS